MPRAASARPSPPPIRLWPGVVAVALQWFVWLVLPLLWLDSIVGYISAHGGLACGLLVVVWWLLLSRAPWLERLGAPVLIVAALIATTPLLDTSIARGAQGLLLGVIAERYRLDPPPAGFRMIVSPLVTWIWLGGLLIAFGGLLALIGRVAGDLRLRERRRLLAERHREPAA